MEKKKKELINFLHTLTTPQLIVIHNRCCQSSGAYFNLCYPLDEKYINMHFGTAGHLFLAIQNSPDFNPNAKYYHLGHARIYTNEIINMNVIADFLIANGITSITFNEDESSLIQNKCLSMLKEAFKDFASNCLRDLKDEVISKTIEESDADFLMDDWNGIITDLFPSIKTICPNCQYALMSEETGEYDYDSGMTFYTCPECGETISC